MASPDVERAAALALLGLSPQADRAEITRAYHRLARLTHPDACRHPGAQERFVALNRAYRTALIPPPPIRQTGSPAASSPPEARTVPLPENRRFVPADELGVGPVHYRPWPAAGDAYPRGPRGWS